MPYLIHTRRFSASFQRRKSWASPQRRTGETSGTLRNTSGIAYEYNLKTAIKEGYLCDIVAKTIPLEIDMNSVKVSMGDFSVDSIGVALEPYLEQIAEAIQIHASARKTVVFCPLISIAQELAGMIPGARGQRNKYGQKRDA